MSGGGSEAGKCMPKLQAAAQPHLREHWLVLGARSRD